MSGELSEKELAGLKDVFGKGMLESMTTLIDSKKHEQDASKILVEARYNTIISKLDTILAKMEDKK